MSETRLFLVRHGETEWSRSGQHTSRTDLPLTETGVAQAEALAARLRSERFTRVFSSPRLRALETCRIAGLEPRGPARGRILRVELGTDLVGDLVRVEPDHPRVVPREADRVSARGQRGEVAGLYRLQVPLRDARFAGDLDQ